MNIGDKVVCIDDDWSTCHDDPRFYFSSLPVKGRVYCVSAFVDTKLGGPSSAMQLVGITQPEGGYGFRPTRFAPLEVCKAKTANREVVKV